MAQSKHDRLEEFIRSHDVDGDYPVHYGLFFALFNKGDYYEAHDVLEHLWLDCHDADSLFYKGLIQIAGGFVHLQKQFLRPDHPKDGKRLRPACRLLGLGSSNIGPFGPSHMGLDVGDLCLRCRSLVRKIEDAEFQINPWTPQSRPLITLQ